MFLRTHGFTHTAYCAILESLKTISRSSCPNCVLARCRLHSRRSPELVALIRGRSKYTGDCLFWYASTSDRGSNEVHATKLIQATCLPMDNVLFFKSDCYEHATHLCVLSGLKLIDRSLKARNLGWKYYSALAIVCNVARDVCKPLFRAWCRLYGESSGVKYVMSMFPACCSGRWGSCHNAESHVLTCTPNHFACSLQSALTDKLDKSHGAVPATAVDDLAIDQSKAFSLKMGTWRRVALERVTDPLWWRVLKVANRAREPLIHLSNFLKVKLSDEELSSGGGHLSRLVCGKAAQIAKEFAALAQAQRWHDIVADLNREDGQWLLCLAACLLYTHACAFNRRVLCKVTSFPERLLVMARADYNVPDPERMVVARDVLDLQDSEIETNTAKVRRFFYAELVAAALHGTCGIRFLPPAESALNMHDDYALAPIGEHAWRSRLSILHVRRVSS